MISFAMDFSKYNQRAVKAALLSTIPGLGQLFNRRLDKAIAFFLVDLANIALIGVLAGVIRLPYESIEATQLINHLGTWRVGTVPFFVIQSLMLTYMLYSQWDAYRDALAAAPLPGKKPDLALSHMTCASYLLHMGGMFVLCLLILLKICPNFHPEEVPQITLTFELDSPEAAQEEKPQGTEGKMGQESDHETDAHSKDKPREDLVQAGTQAAEMSASKQADRPDMKLAADETEAVASKQIITPDTKQTPQEVQSQGAAADATQTTKTASEQVKLQESSKSTQAQKTPAEATQTEMANASNPSEAINDLAKTKIAQLPAATSGMAIKIDEVNASSNAAASSAASASASAKALAQLAAASIGANATVGPQNAEIIQGPYAGLNTPPDPYSYNQDAAAGTAAGGGQEGPSMLGFMDSELSNDESMRALWAEMSGNISRYVKANPMNGQGLAMAQFTLNKSGQPVNIQTAPNGELAQSIVKTIRNMPNVVPPSNNNGMYFQVKASNDGKATFISLEVNSQASTVSEESLSDFKYQTDLQAYLKGIKKAVYSSWKPPVQEGIKPAMVGFKVSTTGRISNQHIVQSSGDPKMDRAALTAALSISKWSQPPAGTNEDMDVCMVLQRCKNCEGEQKKAQAAGVPGYNGPSHKQVGVGFNNAAQDPARGGTVVQGVNTAGTLRRFQTTDSSGPTIHSTQELRYPTRSNPDAWAYPQ